MTVDNIKKMSREWNVISRDPIPKLVLSNVVKVEYDDMDIIITE